MNLHHSVLAAARTFPEEGISQWLDIRKLCDAHTHVIAPTAATCGVHYFFTFAQHLEAAYPGLLAAHEAHVEALRATGVTVHFGRFKRRRVRCASCRVASFRHEEKETDVAMATALVELAVTRACEVIVLVSGDTDLLPAIRVARRLTPGVALWVAFPFGRSNRELAQAADGSFKLSHGQYVMHRLPERVRVLDGRLCQRPAAW